MKRLLVCLLVVGGIAMFAAGCKTPPEEGGKEHPKAEHPAKEHPAAEHPAKAAPKDHPAH